ncbi:MAG: hypothetical protein WCG27_02435 [Pseudomonadota bacterium]
MFFSFNSFSAITLLLKPEEAHFQEQITQNFTSLHNIYKQLTVTERIQFNQILQSRSQTANSQKNQVWTDQENNFFNKVSEKINDQDRHFIQRAMSRFINFSFNVKIQLADLFNPKRLPQKKVKLASNDQGKKGPPDQPSAKKGKKSGMLEIVLSETIDVENLGEIDRVIGEKTSITRQRRSVTPVPTGQSIFKGKLKKNDASDIHRSATTSKDVSPPPPEPTTAIGIDPNATPRE